MDTKYFHQFVLMYGPGKKHSAVNDLTQKLCMTALARD